jgi:hypothetical protein
MFREAYTISTNRDLVHETIQLCCLVAFTHHHGADICKELAHLCELDENSSFLFV